MPPGDFADYYPDACPPDDAVEAFGPLYRFATDDPENPVSPDNYVPYARSGKRFPPHMECQSCGLSVFTDREQVLNLRELAPFRSIPIVIIQPNPTTGKVKNTPSKFTGQNHHTWWLYINETAEEWVEGLLR